MVQTKGTSAPLNARPQAMSNEPTDPLTMDHLLPLRPNTAGRAEIALATVIQKIASWLDPCCPAGRGGTFSPRTVGSSATREAQSRFHPAPPHRQQVTSGPTRRRNSSMTDAAQTPPRFATTHTPGACRRVAIAPPPQRFDGSAQPTRAHEGSMVEKTADDSRTNWQSGAYCCSP